MYSSRQGAQSCFVMGARLHFVCATSKILHVKRFVLFVLLAGIASGAAAPSAKRPAIVPAGVSIGGVRVGGISSEQARSAIAWWYNRRLQFAFNGKHWSVKPAALGASVDVDSAVQQVL